MKSYPANILCLITSKKRKHLPCFITRFQAQLVLRPSMPPAARTDSLNPSRPGENDGMGGTTSGWMELHLASHCLLKVWLAKKQKKRFEVASLVSSDLLHRKHSESKQVKQVIAETFQTKNHDKITDHATCSMSKGRSQT